MEIKLSIPEYSEQCGINIIWRPGFEIKTKIENGVFSLVANKEGLISLALHLLTLSQENVPSGYHIHYDEYNSLEEGSNEIFIEKE